MRILVLVLLTSVVTPCGAQRLGLGAKAGLRLTSDLQGDAVSESKRYVVGPSVEIAFAHGWALEFDALYSRFGYRTGGSDPAGGFSLTSQRANLWEFPMLLKYSRGRPFAVLGYAPRRTAGSFHTVGANADFSGRQTPFEFAGTTLYPVTHGLVVGGGVALGGHHLRLAPEVRYIRWNEEFVDISGSRGYHVNAATNEVRLLLGILWR